MRKAFDQNVSRSKPRLRLGALGDALGPADNDLEISSVLTGQATVVAPGQAPISPSEATLEQPAAKSARKSAAEALKAKAPPAMDPQARRERLKARLKAARENPRQEPLPPTVAEAGLLGAEKLS